MIDLSVCWSKYPYIYLPVYLDLDLLYIWHLENARDATGVLHGKEEENLRIQACHGMDISIDLSIYQSMYLSIYLSNYLDLYLLYIWHLENARNAADVFHGKEEQHLRMHTCNCKHTHMHACGHQSLSLSIYIYIYLCFYRYLYIYIYYTGHLENARDTTDVLHGKEKQHLRAYKPLREYIYLSLYLSILLSMYTYLYIIYIWHL